MGDALRYVMQSLHFGIYLFIDFAEHLRPVDTILPAHFAHANRQRAQTRLCRQPFRSARGIASAMSPRAPASNRFRTYSKTLHGLRGLGCGISIDDFGTGQSSLDYIKRFPADRIKIDQAFVRNIGFDPGDEAIVRAIISMAHDLNRKVVAEGVEIKQHQDFLRGEGCEVLQGFLFCRPLPAASFENLLAERARLLGSVAESPAAHA